MYEKVNISEMHLRTLALFTTGEDYYIREIHRLLAISPRTAQLTLNDLENKGVLSARTRGKIRVYTAKNTSYLILAEHYKTIAFFEKNPFIKELLEKIRPTINGIGILFGSYANGTATKASDIDVFVAGTYDKERTTRIAKTYNVNLSIKCYPKETFEKNIQTDILLKEILKNHILLKGAEEYTTTWTKSFGA